MIVGPPAYANVQPQRKPLTVTGYEQSVEGRKHINIAEIKNQQGEVLARSTGTFIAIDPEKMFARNLPTIPAGATQPGTKA